MLMMDMKWMQLMAHNNLHIKKTGNFKVYFEIMQIMYSKHTHTHTFSAKYHCQSHHWTIQLLVIVSTHENNKQQTTT